MPCSNDLCERYGQHRQEWHEEEEETMSAVIRLQVIRRMQAKLEAAEEMEKKLRLVHRNELPYHFVHYENCEICQILMAWEQAGKGKE